MKKTWLVLRMVSSIVGLLIGLLVAGGAAITQAAPPEQQGVPSPCVNAGTVESARVVSASGLNVVGPGRHFEVEIKLRNTGTCPWASGYSLQSQGQGDYRRQAGVDSGVPYTNGGEVAAILLEMRAPDEEGLYTQELNLVSGPLKPFVPISVRFQVGGGLPVPTAGPPPTDTPTPTPPCPCYQVCCIFDGTRGYSCQSQIVPCPSGSLTPFAAGAVAPGGVAPCPPCPACPACPACPTCTPCPPPVPPVGGAVKEPGASAGGAAEEPGSSSGGGERVLVLPTYTPPGEGWFGREQQESAGVTPSAPPSEMERMPIVCADDAAFVSDVTVPDGTVFRPGEAFSKQWRVRNIADCNWDESYRLVRVGGDPLGAPESVSLGGSVARNEEIDVAVPMTAPGEPGGYRSEWQLANGGGDRFGSTLSAVIRVLSPEAAAQCLSAVDEGKPLLVEHTDCERGIQRLQEAMEAASALIDAGAGDLECALAGGLEPGRAAEARQELTRVREEQSALVCANIGGPTFAPQWEGETPLGVSTTFPAGQMRNIEVRWPIANACGERTVVAKWFVNEKLSCMHDWTEPWSPDWTWTSSGWEDEAGIPAGHYCVSLWSGGRVLAGPSCFDVQ